jgi:hypothetical protein
VHTAPITLDNRLIYRMKNGQYCQVLELDYKTVDLFGLFATQAIT